MRKIVVALFLFFILVSCQNEPYTDNTGIPEIKKVIVSDTLTNLINGIEKDTFTVGETVYFGLTITDNELDLEKVVITQKSALLNIDPIAIQIPNQIRDTDFYYSTMIPDFVGTWTIEGYAVDKKGNKSNTVSKLIIINEVLYTVSFESNGGSGVQPIENVISGSKIDKPANPTKQDSEFLGWFIDEQLEIEWNFESDVVERNITLYAKWVSTTPKDVIMTGGFWNDGRYEIWFNSLNDNTIDHIEVFIDGKMYYDDIPSTYISVYLYQYSIVDNNYTQPIKNFDNGSIVTIYTVSKTGIYSNGVSHIISGVPGLVLSGSVNIMGIAQVGETLSANTYNLGGTGEITYQWIRGESTYIGTNSNTYIIVAGDLGYSIKVTVSRNGYNGSITSQPTAVVSQPLSIPIRADVSAGGNHSLVLKADGTVWAVGNNQYGQLGTGDNVNRTNFVQVASGVASISAGENHSLILKTDGTVLVAGSNGFGQLGTNNDRTDRNNFVQVASGVISISAGRYNSIIIKSNGTAWDTGAYSHGSGYSYNYFEQTATDVISISAGGSHNLILKTDGTVWASGQNYNGVLGTGDTADRFSLIQVASDCKAIAAGYSHSLILKTNGTVWATGSNDRGALGSNDVIDHTSFIQVATDVISVSAGDRFSHIIKTDGSINATGLCIDGQLGVFNMATIYFARFQPVDIGNNNLTVSAGYRHSLLLKADGTIWATGNNEYGQLGTGDHSNSSVFVNVF